MTLPEKAFYQNVLYGINMYFKVILLFRKQPYLSYRELGRLGTPVEHRSFTKKEPFVTLRLQLQNLAVLFVCLNFDYELRCHLTILSGIHVDAKFFGSSPGFFYRTQSDPGFVNPVGSSPGFVNPVRSDPIRSDPGFVNAPYRGRQFFFLLIFW